MKCRMRVEFTVSVTVNVTMETEVYDEIRELAYETAEGKMRAALDPKIAYIAKTEVVSEETY